MALSTAVQLVTSRALPDATDTPVTCAVSLSGSAMVVAVPKAVPSREPVTSMLRWPSTVSFAAAVTVTCTEAVSAGNVTWWPVAFASASTGVTL